MPNDNELEFYEKEAAEHKAAIAAALERYERLEGKEVLCTVCKWRQAPAFTGVCEKCADEVIAVREVR